LQESMF